MHESNSMGGSNSISAYRGLLKSGARELGVTLESARNTLSLPIQILNSRHAARITKHLTFLSPSDRYLRFGYAAQDRHIQCYVTNLDFEGDVVLGIVGSNQQLLAVAHLANTKADATLKCAEFGVSVALAARGKGYGAKLFASAAKHAQENGIETMFIHALSENHQMLKIAKNAGAVVKHNGYESEAYLHIPAMACT